MEPQKTPDSQKNTKQKEQCWIITIPELKMCFTDIVIKTSGMVKKEDM